MKASPNKKSQKQISIKKAWKEFEELIARIERILAPEGVVIKSPDKIPDIHTGKLREVDASIRAFVGSTEVLITIECRNRSKSQDTTWIEQLKTKKDNIGAAKTIAVSANGFTQEALNLAKRCGIEVRTIKRITDNVINQWRFYLNIFHFRYNALNYDYVVEVPDGREKYFEEELDKIKAGKSDEEFWFLDFLYYPKINKQVSLSYILEQTITSHQDDLVKKLKAESKTEKEFDMAINIPKGTFFFTRNEIQFHIVKLNVRFKFSEYYSREITPTSFTYSDSEKDIFKGLEYKFQNPLGEDTIITLH